MKGGNIWLNKQINFQIINNKINKYQTYLKIVFLIKDSISLYLCIYKYNLLKTTRNTIKIHKLLTLQVNLLKKRIILKILQGKYNRENSNFPMMKIYPRSIFCSKTIKYYLISYKLKKERLSNRLWINRRNKQRENIEKGLTTIKYNI